MNFDDPKLTAYALGELESAEDLASVEALLRDHPELAAEVEETRRMGKILRQELKSEQGAALTTAQRDEVLAAAIRRESVNSTPVTNGETSWTTESPSPWYQRLWVPSAIAAVVVLSSSIALLWDQQKAHSIRVAASAPPTEEAPQTASIRLDSNNPSPPPVPASPQSRGYLKDNALSVQDPQDESARAKAGAKISHDKEMSEGKPLSPVLQSAQKAAPPGLSVTASTLSIADPSSSSSLFSNEGTPARAKPVNTSWYFERTRGLASPETRGRERFVRLEPLKNSPEQIGRIAEQIEPSNTESYDSITDNAFLAVKENPLSTFSIDVDTASYSLVRRFLMNNQRPPKGAVRIEELVNYFPYSYPESQGNDPFSCSMEVAACPWTPQHRLVRVGLKGREIAKEKLPPSNLVFLIDVSGSMESENKLPLVKESMKELVSTLREQDTAGIVVYAGSSGTVLEPTNDKEAIRAALDRLQAGGSTNGASGIRGAYELARRAFKKKGNNRVILCTDGDFNVGITSQSELVDLIQREAKSGVFLSVLGFGMGNTKDSTMEKLADKGNGNYAYIDSLKEGRKVLVEQMAGTLFTIAKDVKIQVEFNPGKVGAYRLIGYENRLLAKEDFNDDTKDAGEIGAGHTVTALYEVVPAGAPLPTNTTVDPLKYQPSQQQTATNSEPQKGRTEATTEMLTLKLRFKQPDADKSVLREFPLTDSEAGWEKSSADFRWSAAVASFGMLLRDSPHRGNATWDTVTQLANDGKGSDDKGYRAEFIQLIDRARQLVPVMPRPTDTEQPKETEITQSNASSLVIPEFEVTDAPILDAIDALSAKSREVDPNKKGVSVVFAGGASGAQTKVSLRMHNTSVFDTAKAMATAAGLTLQEQGDVLILKAARSSGK